LASEAKRAITETVDTLTLVLGIFGLSDQKHHAPTTSHWQKLAMAAGGKWMKVVKYKLAAFYAYHHGQTLPVAPFNIPDKPNHLIGGKPGRFIKFFLDHYPLRREELLQSIKQLKKGLPRPNQKDLAEAKKAFAASMVIAPDTPKPKFLVEWGLSDTYPERIEQLLSKKTMTEQLHRTVKELFKETNYTLRDRLTHFFPSTSSNYINSRAGAGTLGVILGVHKKGRGGGLVTDVKNSVLEGLRKPGGVVSTTVVWEDRGREITMEDLFEDLEEDGLTHKTVSVEDDPLKTAFGRLWFRILKKASEEVPVVKPVALPEALKIRMITAMPPYQQFVLRNLWKRVHRTLRQHPAFLIGQPVSEEAILNRMGSKLGDNEVYLSGDYEAATDNLHSWASEEVVRAISQHLNLATIEQKLFVQSLTGHLFNIQGVLTPQRRGQLMGSITSFPILCIINATIGRWAIELAEKRVFTLKDARMMINGDDIAIRSKRPVYGFWKTLASFVGLNESVGKTYVSRDFVDLNSTSFMREEETHEITVVNKKSGETKVRDCPFRLTKYINAGLLKGLKRSGSVGLSDQMQSDLNVGTRAREFLRFCPEELRNDAMRFFIKFHRDKVLAKARLPWYIPEWLGGFGLPTGEWGQPSNLDKRIARRILMNWKITRPIQTNKQDVPWKIWQRAEESLPKPVYTPFKDEHTESYTAAVATKCVNLLFDSNIEIDDIFEEAQDVSIGAIRRNEKLWRVMAGDEKIANLPQPLEDAKLVFVPLYPNYYRSVKRTDTTVLPQPAQIVDAPIIV
jgi:hypothetical protein